MNAYRDYFLTEPAAGRIPMVLCGTGCDSEGEGLREVTTVNGQELANSWGVPFFEASSATGLNVEEVFAQIVLAILKEKQVGSLTQQLKMKKPGFMQIIKKALYKDRTEKGRIEKEKLRQNGLRRNWP